MKFSFKRLFFWHKADKQPSQEEQPDSALAQQRHEILQRARSFIEPLVPNKHRTLILTGVIVLLTVFLFLGAFALLIYRHQSDNSFVYQVSRIIPYPAAKVNGQYVSYGDYLFELKPLKHFYSNPSGPAAAVREPVDFTTPDGQAQLAELERTAFQEVKKKIIVEQLAAEHGVSVAKSEVDAAVQEAVSREGGEDKFKEVINTYYGWTLPDFREALRDQLLRRELLPILSVQQREKANNILQKIQEGGDFGKLAKQHSADSGSKNNGGDLGFAPKGTYVPEFEEAAYALEPGEVSDVVPSQLGFHIIKVLEKESDRIRAAHILIEYQNFETLIQERLQNAEVDTYIDLAESNSAG